MTEAPIHGRRLVTYNLHFERKGKESLRLQQLRQVLEDARQHAEPLLVILGGDFNLNGSYGDAARRRFP